MKILFMGTPDFAVPSLKMLLENHEVLAVVTQPDRPKGRGKKLIPPVIKVVAEERQIPVLQPEKVRDPAFIEALKGYQPELIVVVAFGQILPEEILNLPKYGCVNVHGSLLPNYRGAAPIQWAVINGDEKTGVTTMYMAKGLDSGDMLLKREMEIFPEDTYGSLHDRMAPMGAAILQETIALIAAGKAEAIPQEHDKMTLAPMITKELEHICWNRPAKEIVQLLKGLSPNPGAYTVYNGESLKVWDAAVIEEEYTNAEAGEIVEIQKKGFIVKAADRGILIKEVQAKGGKRMTSDAYMRGHTLEKGTLLT